MYSLVIKDTEYQLPEDFTISHWKEITKYDISIPFNHKKIISVAFKIDYDEVDIIPDKTVELLIAFISVMLYPQDSQLKKDYMGGDYINLNGLTLGKFIDLEIHLSDGINKGIDKLIETLWGIDVTDEVKISGVWGGINTFIDYRNNLYKNYTNLFGTDEDGEYLKVEKDTTTVDIKRIWYDIILTLAEGKFLYIDKVTDKPLISAFNWLAWNKDKMEKEQEQLKKNDLQRNNRHI